nr:YdcF family protein [Lysinibacillus timonensis]
MRHNKRWLRLILFIIAAFLIFIGYLAYSIWSFSEKVQLVKTDAAVVLGAATWGDDPSPVFSERINHAIWLYEKGYVEKIIFTGGKGEGAQFAESEVARDYAIRNDIPSTDILIETKSTITEENLQYAYNLASEHDLKTFAIVSDPLHMKRAMLMAETIGMNAYTSPTQTTAYQTLGSQLPFFLRELFYYIGYIFTMPFR